jgi:hypothetical protein
MLLKGHVHHGVILIDDDGVLPEGCPVSILAEPAKQDDASFMALRGSVLAFPDPFASGLPEGDWDALR